MRRCAAFASHDRPHDSEHFHLHSVPCQSNLQFHRSGRASCKNRNSRGKSKDRGSTACLSPRAVHRSCLFEPMERQEWSPKERFPPVPGKCHFGINDARSSLPPGFPWRAYRPRCSPSGCHWYRCAGWLSLLGNVVTHSSPERLRLDACLQLRRRCWFS
jgi:hypothetical protein